ncbi:MAG: serine/threonine protein kinase [Deltaproteobacteria bacterium]|nr:serine/threonine protein kinase [Deltaproteobacteria bacterium]
MRLESGLLLGGRFRLVNRLSRGRFGELWRGADRVPSRCVAIRVIRPPDDDALAEAWFEELRAASTLEHPNVARILAFGRTEEAEPLGWIASELLVGETLNELLERRGTLPTGGALQLCADLAGALAEAHARGVVHGAIEPRSILLHRHPDGGITAKLVDFGRARWLASQPKADRAPRAYDCPTAGPDDPRRDVWALGMLLVRCVSGRLPLSAQTEAAFLAQASRLGYALETLLVDERVRRIAIACLSPTRDPRLIVERAAARLDAADLASRARSAASSTRGGWSAFERMVRVPDVYLDARRWGALDHWKTIPGIADVLDAPMPSAVARRPVGIRATHVGAHEAEDEQLVSIPLPADEQPPRPPWPSDDVRPTLDEPLVDLRPPWWRWRALAAASVMAAVAIVVAASTSHERTSLPRVPTGLARAEARAEALTAPPLPSADAAVTLEPPVPPAAAAPATAVACPDPTKAAQLVISTPSRGGGAKATAVANRPGSAGAAPIPKNAGIPLWEAKPTKEKIENPYE